MTPAERIDAFHDQTGLKRLSPYWAKFEIFLGLNAVSFGLRLLYHNNELLAVTGIALFALGGYLALAGHRSHQYQSNNFLASYLGGRIESQQSQRNGNT